MHFNTLSKAKRGDTIAIKIIFAGLQLSDDFMADATYDLKILDPEGKIYDDLDTKNLEAVKAKTPVRTGVFDTRAYIKINFETKDKLGKYKIIAEIRDNVANKKIPLTEEIELIE